LAKSISQLAGACGHRSAAVLTVEIRIDAQKERPNFVTKIYGWLLIPLL